MLRIPVGSVLASEVSFLAPPGTQAAGQERVFATVRSTAKRIGHGSLVAELLLTRQVHPEPIQAFFRSAQALGAVLMPVQVGKLFGVDHVCATPTGEELDRDQRDRQPASVDPDVISKHDASRIYDVEEDLLDLLDKPVGVDKLVRLMPERTEVKTVLGCVLGMAVGSLALGLRVGPGLEDCLRGGGEVAIDDKVGVCFIVWLCLSARPDKRRAGRTVR